MIDPISLGKYVLFLHTSYSITRESEDHSRINGMNYDAVMGREFNEKFAAYTGFHYRKSNKYNSLFEYDNDDYSSELETGFSYKLDDKNRVVIGYKFNTESGSLKDIDYYWYHDLHCSQLIMRYREKRDKFEARWQFTPW